MPALNWFDKFLFSASRACCTPLAIFVQIQVNSVSFVFTDSFGWIRERQRGGFYSLDPRTWRAFGSGACEISCGNAVDMNDVMEVSLFSLGAGHKLERLEGLVIPNRVIDIQINGLKRFEEMPMMNPSYKNHTKENIIIQAFCSEDVSDAQIDILLRTTCSREDGDEIAIAERCQGYVICLVLALGWACAAYVRNREIKRMKHRMKCGNCFAFLCEDINELEHSNQANLPRVTIVMPLKGFGEHNLHNWRSQITSLYGGPLEFLFVVESEKDPAYSAVKQLLDDYQDEVDAKIVVAGLSTTCSQKIHNQLVGVQTMHKDTKYVLFLDDDVRLHPGSIGALTAEMEKNPEIFIQTGYPLDLPSGSLGSYCIYEYHMVGVSLYCIYEYHKPCSMGFATGGKTFFLWGGCMMMHADDFREDRHGVVSQLQDGGYSDDMTLAAIADVTDLDDNRVGNRKFVMHKMKMLYTS
nr:Ceramide glucosyltransferase-A like [Ipomoea batatas]